MFMIRISPKACPTCARSTRELCRKIMRHHTAFGLHPLWFQWIVVIANFPLLLSNITKMWLNPICNLRQRSVGSTCTSGKQQEGLVACMWQSAPIIFHGHIHAKNQLRKFHRIIPTRDTIWPWMLFHGFYPVNHLCPKTPVLMYLWHTMSTIAPEHHYVLMREVDISAALHASDRPAKQQLSPNKMQCKGLPTMCLTKTSHTMISLCTCYILCLQLPLNTTMYWCVKLICQLPCMHQTAPPNSSWVQTKQCKSLPMCLTKNTQKMIQPVTNETVVNKCQQFLRSHSVPETSWEHLTMSSQLVSPCGHECLTKNTHTMMQSVTRNKCLHQNSLLCVALCPHGIRLSSLHCHCANYHLLSPVFMQHCICDWPPHPLYV